MVKLFFQRLAVSVPLLIIATAATFFLLQLSDTDPAVIRLGDSATDEQYEAVRAELGVDRSAVRQYVDWAGGAAHLDFGESWARGVPVWGLVKQRIPATVSLTLGAILVAVSIGVPLSMAAGIRAGTVRDSALTAVASVGQAIPNFWAALMLIAYVALKTDLFDATGYTPITDSFTGWLQSIALPSIALGTAGSAAIARQARAAVASTVGRPFVRTAVAVGYSRWSILGRDVLRNASIPIVTVIGIQTSFLLGGAFIVEDVFQIPGMGKLAFDAILRNDIPVVLAVVAVAALMITLIQLVLDLVYGVLDPRVRV
ncbi:MAG: ABC transporter permease [Acidimicrobiales bacterium]